MTFKELLSQVRFVPMSFVDEQVGAGQRLTLALSVNDTPKPMRVLLDAKPVRHRVLLAVVDDVYARELPMLTSMELAELKSRYADALREWSEGTSEIAAH